MDILVIISLPTTKLSGGSEQKSDLLSKWLMGRDQTVGGKGEAERPVRGLLQLPRCEGRGKWVETMEVVRGNLLQAYFKGKPNRIS